MTEQEIEQARAEVDQLDIEQLRCGVLLQLLHIEALKKERDECKAQYSDALGQISHLDAKRDTLALEVDQWRVDFHELRLERDALAAAGKMALDFVGFCWRDVTLNEYAEDRRGNVEIALRQAGVQ